MDEKTRLEGEIAKLIADAAEESRLALIKDREKAEAVAEKRGPDVKTQPVYVPDEPAKPKKPRKKARKAKPREAQRRENHERVISIGKTASKPGDAAG